MFDHTKQKVYFKGDYVDFDEAHISVANTSFLYGLGFFTGMRANLSKKKDQLYLFRPEKHYSRLLKAAKVFRFNNFISKITKEKFVKIIKDLILINEIKENAYIRVNCSLDETAIGPKFGGYKDDLNIFLFPLGDYVPTNGIKCKVSSWNRIQDNAIPARLKPFGAYVNTALAKSEALDAGFDEAIVLDSQGQAVEGSAENLFIIRDNKIITPGFNDDLLEGVNRDSIIQLARDLGYEVEERSVDRTELYYADEIFLSGTGAKMAPVVQVDHVAIGDGKIGKISKKLQKEYFDIVCGSHKKYQEWLEPVY